MKAIDLFSGPGGMTIGMRRAGFTPIVSVEKRKDAVETYSGHTPDAEHFNDDIRKISFEKYRGKVDLIYGGPPCQPFSTGGLRKGTADARNMFPEFIRAIREVRPQAFIAENVPGLATKSRLRYLAELLELFERENYNVTWKVLLAADYGVPQKRRRLFIVGTKENTFCFPKPTHGEGLESAHLPTSAVVDKLKPLGTPPDCPVVFAKFPDPRRNPYAGHVYNGGGRPIDLDAPCHTILASAGGYKTHWIDTLDIAPDYAAHLMEGGEPREGEVPGARRLTVEESALIQTFPQEMTFAGSRSSQYTQVGDAVPPILAEVLGRAMMKQLNGEGLSSEEFLDPVSTMPLFDAA
ncbi:MAG: DNA cytosine methyltransferase [Pseudomonadota bacterium]